MSNTRSQNASAGRPAPPASVCLICATYNGGRFLREQLESLFTQTCTNWILLVRDDGSRDETAAILERAAAEDGRVRLIRDGLGNVGPARNFGLLMEHPLARQADYVMCCDQDDVWKPDKIERTLAVAIRTEREVGRNTPVLVHTDLEVVDAALCPIHASFMRFQRIRHAERNPLRTLLVQNFVTGCTMMFNQPLLRLATPVPPGVVMHDWWLAACAAAAGRIAFVPEPTIRYRQHGRNQVGARGYWRSVNPLLKNWHHLSSVGTQRYLDAIRQGRLLRRHLANRRETGPDDAIRLLNEFDRLFDQRTSRWARLCGVRRHRLRRQDFLRNLLFLLRIVTTPNGRYDQDGGGDDRRRAA